MLDKSSKIYVAGHNGLVGSAIWNNLKSRGYDNLVGRSHKELDLLDPVAVREFFDQEKPDAVVLAAAHVGGMMANLKYRADFIYKNLQIQQNVIGESFRHGVQKLLFLGSTCIYPREAPQPMSEDVLLNVDFKDTYKEGERDIRNCHINVGTGKEITIKEVAEKIMATIGFKGELRWDASKPDGTMKKLTDVTKLHNLGWHHKIEIDEGVRLLYDGYKKGICINHKEA